MPASKYYLAAFRFLAVSKK